MKYTWNRHVITTHEELSWFIRKFLAVKPYASAFDTETTGLHIILDRMFLFIFGFTDERTNQGYVACVDTWENPEARFFIELCLTHVKSCQFFIAHNVKYDLHMLKNDGYTYEEPNLTDLQFYIRWGHDNLQVEKGGPPLKLKDYCSRYVDRNAKDNERELSVLKKQFKKKHGRDAGYHELDRATVIRYAMEDIVLTLEAIWQLQPIVKIRGNQYAIKVENDAIMPLFEMERVGFKADKAYLIESEERMRLYIKQSYVILHQLTGTVFTVGQHALIKKIINEYYKVPCPTTNAEALNQLMDKLDKSHPVVDFIKLVQELRTLDKWYATYIVRFLKELENTDVLYTTIHQVGTVSGRVTSDFQQFPKEGILTRDGEQLFTPRKMVLVRGGDYNQIVYLDYSQIELRLQALYTVLLDQPDLNLCRAYMPFNCIDENGEVFDCRRDLARVRDPWFYREEPAKRWTPTDVHAATAIHAFNTTPEDPKFSKYRSFAKRINFAKNYGAQYTRIAAMFPNATPDEVHRINDSYYKAFPGVKVYHSYCYAIAGSKAFVGNMFGVRYYNVSGHNLINMLIQGSSATLLKLKIRQIYDYTKKHKIKSRFQMNIHDELSWEKHKDESMEVFYEFKRIMEDWDDTLVPIVAEMEVTETCWAEKHEVAHG